MHNIDNQIIIVQHILVSVYCTGYSEFCDLFVFTPFNLNEVIICVLILVLLSLVFSWLGRELSSCSLKYVPAICFCSVVTYLHFAILKSDR
jgi:hypothetical protein